MERKHVDRIWVKCLNCITVSIMWFTQLDTLSEWLPSRNFKYILFRGKRWEKSLYVLFSKFQKLLSKDPVSLMDLKLPGLLNIPCNKVPLKQKYTWHAFFKPTCNNKDIKWTDISALQFKITSCVTSICCAVSSISDFLNTGFAFKE